MKHQDIVVEERVVITDILPAYGDGFGLVESTGQGVYFPTRVVHGAQLEAGTIVTCRLAANTRPDARTPLFAVFASKEGRVMADPRSVELVEAWLAEGDAWQAEDVAHEIDLPRAIVESALEKLDRDGKVGKFVEFRHDSRAGLRIWYSARPEDCDVGDCWEDGR